MRYTAKILNLVIMSVHPPSSLTQRTSRQDYFDEPECVDCDPFYHAATERLPLLVTVRTGRDGHNVGSIVYIGWNLPKTLVTRFGM